MLPNFVERRAIAAIIRAGRAKSQGAAWESCSNNFSDFSHPVIVGIVSDVEDLVVHGFDRRLQYGNDGSRNIQTMDQRPPGCAIAGHANLLGRPSKPREI